MLAGLKESKAEGIKLARRTLKVTFTCNKCGESWEIPPLHACVVCSYSTTSVQDIVEGDAADPKSVVFRDPYREAGQSPGMGEGPGLCAV